MPDYEDEYDDDCDEEYENDYDDDYSERVTPFDGTERYYDESFWDVPKVIIVSLTLGIVIPLTGLLLQNLFVYAIGFIPFIICISMGTILALSNNRLNSKVGINVLAGAICFITVYFIGMVTIEDNDVASILAMTFMVITACCCCISCCKDPSSCPCGMALLD